MAVSPSPSIFSQLIMLLPFLAIGYLVYRRIRSTADGWVTYADYIKKYPQCNTNGRVSCSQCGSKDIFLRKIGNTMSNYWNSHVCKQCGAELYRSKTPM
jgi:hypothetical protein